MKRRTIWIGAGVAAAARLARWAHGARREPAPNGQRLRIQAAVAPETIADLADLVRRVTGRAMSDDEAGEITVNLVRGIEPLDAQLQLQALVHRWSEMHPGVRVRVTLVDEAQGLRRRARLRGRVRAEQPVSVADP